jgi:hypothetical protein
MAGPLIDHVVWRCRRQFPPDIMNLLEIDIGTFPRASNRTVRPHAVIRQNRNIIVNSPKPFTWRLPICLRVNNAFVGSVTVS